MVPRIGGQGRSFKGAALYYLHDKGRASTDDRVWFTHTENLPTDDPEMAWRWMARTAMDAEHLKRADGHTGRGQKSTKPVFTFSLSWAQDEEPEQEHVIDTMRSALKALGLQDRQAIIVGHQDTQHPHAHVIVNLVDPVTGRSGQFDAKTQKYRQLKFSKEALSKWAQQYEELHGGIRIEQRRKNNAAREQEQALRAQWATTKQAAPKAAYPRASKAAAAAALKADVAKLYATSKDAATFQRAMAARGYTIAQGRRIVFVDGQGTQYALARHLDGPHGKAAALRRHLAGLDLPELDDVLARQRQTERAGGERTSPSAPAKGQRRAQTPQEAARPRERVYHRPALLNRLQAAQAAERGQFSDTWQRRQHQLDDTLETAYGEQERTLGRAIAQRQQRIERASVAGRWLLKTFTRNHDALEADRRSLAGLQQRRAEQAQALALERDAARAQLEERHAADRRAARTLAGPALKAFAQRFETPEPSTTEQFHRAANDNAPAADDDLQASFERAKAAQQQPEQAPTPTAPATDYEQARAAYMERASERQSATEVPDQRGPTQRQG